MKLFWFLITFVLVNVSANDETIYKKEVFLTNAAIELAYAKNDLIVGDNSATNALEHVIEKIVNNTSSFQIPDFYHNFAKINVMIAVPDKTDIVGDLLSEPSQYDHLLDKCSFYQFNMQQEIRQILNLVILEGATDQDFRSLDLTTLAEQRRSLVKPALKNIIRRKLADDVQEFRGLNWTALAERRRVTGTSLGNIIRRRVSDVSELEDSLLLMCRLLGVYMSTTCPTSYVKKLLFDFINLTCTLDDGSTQKKMYKKIDGLWWQINPVNNSTVQLLEEQLL
ncbi:uncharacterized protein LOC126847199 [Adelges cooleyi]|uniref:uncharacterized protein LOC126847199 n=1 Tax=Adelges cooleyi TaxID=133065 RepID=UPI00217F8D35|nr:uncharacterized protein LOC126847199 [Adelges cooleyi]